MLIKSGVPSYPSPETNDKAPAYSWWSGPGLLYAFRGALCASVRSFVVQEYRDTAGRKNRSTGPQMVFMAVLHFLARSAPLDTGAKMPPGGHGRPHKRRKATGEYRDKGGHVGGLGGHKKPAPGKPRAGAGGIQDFFAVSQIIIRGRARINRIIKRGPPPPGLYI